MSAVENNDKALSRAMHYCAYQERSQKEVLTKLKAWGVSDLTSQNILATLIEKDYVNEERFSKAFVSGKFFLKKWGKIKITIELKAKGIDKGLIAKGLEEISDKEYKACLAKLISEKTKIIKGENDYIVNNKVANYLLRKGFESELIWEMIKLKE